MPELYPPDGDPSRDPGRDGAPRGLWSGERPDLPSRRRPGPRALRAACTREPRRGGSPGAGQRPGHRTKAGSGCSRAGSSGELVPRRHAGGCRPDRGRRGGAGAGLGPGDRPRAARWRAPGKRPALPDRHSRLRVSRAPSLGLDPDPRARLDSGHRPDSARTRRRTNVRGARGRRGRSDVPRCSHRGTSRRSPSFEPRRRRRGSGAHILLPPGRCVCLCGRAPGEPCTRDRSRGRPVGRHCCYRARHRARGARSRRRRSLDYRTRSAPRRRARRLPRRHGGGPHDGGPLALGPRPGGAVLRGHQPARDDAPRAGAGGSGLPLAPVRADRSRARGRSRPCHGRWEPFRCGWRRGNRPRSRLCGPSGRAGRRRAAAALHRPRRRGRGGPDPHRARCCHRRVEPRDPGPRRRAWRDRRGPGATARDLLGHSDVELVRPPWW